MIRLLQFAANYIIITNKGIITAPKRFRSYL